MYKVDELINLGAAHFSIETIATAFHDAKLFQIICYGRVVLSWNQLRFLLSP